VLIVEDDTSTRLLLESLIRRLWPNSRIEAFGEVQSALDSWRQQGADLALVDIDLPGVGGLALLEQIAREPARGTISVIVSHHHDRAIVMQALRYRARDYIVKPFTARDLMQRIGNLLQVTATQRAPGSEAPTMETLERLLRDAIGYRRLSLPIDPALVERMEEWNLAGTLSTSRILEHWNLEPALVARLLGAANSGPYNPDGRAVVQFAQALDLLDPGTICNLAIALALQPGSALVAAPVRVLAEEARACQRALYQQVRALGAPVRAEIGLFATACALYRLGELAILQLIQTWIDQGGEITSAEAVELVERHGPEADDAIKTQWLIPQQLRDLSRAPDERPRGTPNQAQLLMRIAGLEFHAEHGEQGEELKRLRERAGLPTTERA
jgi:CheY-like chemotaxis protein